MTDFDPETRALLASARRAGPPKHLKTRTRERVLAAAAAGTLSVAVTSAKASILSSLWSSALGAMVIGVGAGVAVSTSAIFLTSPEPRAVTSAQPPIVKPEPAAVAPVPTSRVAMPSAAEPARAESSSPEPVSALPFSNSASPVRSIERETLALTRAQKALRQGNPVLALELLASYYAEFPRGALREEALAVQVIALCSSGKREEGKRSLVAFMRTYSHSPLLGSVRAACADSHTQ